MSQKSVWLAHGIVSQEDLPLPLGWAVTGAAAAVVVSFVALALLWREPRPDAGKVGHPLPAGLARAMDSVAVRAGLRAIGLLATGYALLGLVFGPDNADNPTPWVVYVLLWVGLVPLSLLFGPVWRLISPLRTVHWLVHRALGLDPREGIRPLPPGVGWWPSAAGLLAFAWLELVYPDAVRLAVLQAAVAGYAAIHLLAGVVFGSGWYDRGEAFETWSTMYSLTGVLGRRADRSLVVRRPMAGLERLSARPGLVAVVAVMLGSTAYDGLSNSPTWVGFAQSSPLPRMLVDTAGLVGAVAAVAGLFAVCTSLAGRAAGLPSAGMPGAFAPSVVPVALGYVVAHYYSLLAVEGQRAFIKLTDPLGTGADWLHTADWTPHTGLIAPTIVANVQLGAIVTGHVLGVTLAHSRAVELFPRRAAVVGQIPLLVLMVTLTCGGLLLLFAS